MKKSISKLREKITIFLSHHPKLYALVVGIGIVLFWRGVWHTTDSIHGYLSFYQKNSTIGSFFSSWWDGPLSLAVGVLILYFAGAFISSFIGNELILSGLRREKRLAQKTESEVKGEKQFILDIKNELGDMTGKIEQLEKEIYKKNAEPE